jgi:hypothetical protein
MFTHDPSWKRVRTALYWTSTSLIALSMFSGGALSLAGAEGPVQGMTELGYPVYFVTILGVAKVLGTLAILAPRFPRLKEWAYAGVTFDLLGASASHAAAGHPAGKVIVPLVLLGIAVASWALRPESRRWTAASMGQLDGREKSSPLDVQPRPLQSSPV